MLPRVKVFSISYLVLRPTCFDSYADLLLTGLKYIQTSQASALSAVMSSTLVAAAAQ